MREILSDILKQTSSLYECLSVTLDDTGTSITAIDKNATVFLQARLKKQISEFVGEFGMNNLPMLSGLLNFPSYNTDDATVTVGRGKYREKEISTNIKFEDGKGGFADYRLVMPNLIPDQATIGEIPWEVSFEPNRSRLTEFQQLSVLYNSASDGKFTFKTSGNDLYVLFGEEDSGDHSASMVFQNDVENLVKGNVKFPTSVFLSVIKLAGTNPINLRISQSGPMKIEIETQYAQYNYIIRGSW